MGRPAETKQTTPHKGNISRLEDCITVPEQRSKSTAAKAMVSPRNASVRESEPRPLHSNMVDRATRSLGVRSGASVIMPQAYPDMPFLARALRGTVSSMKPSFTSKQQSVLTSSFSKSEAGLTTKKPNPAHSTTCCLRRKVHFDANDRIHSFELIEFLHSDIWWTVKELEVNRFEERSSARFDESVYEYVNAHTRAHHEVCRKDRLSASNMEALVQGLKLGHRGMEFITCNGG